MIHKPRHLVTAASIPNQVFHSQNLNEETSHKRNSKSPKSFYTKVYEKLNTAMSRERFLAFACHIMETNEEDLALELMRSCGLWIEIDDREIVRFSDQNFNDCEFCFVDIETTGSKPDFSSVIEIGAIKVKDQKIIDSFESLVYAKEVPQEIVELTGIRADMLAGAPNEKDVLKAFRAFLGNSVFVAHNVVFDYRFISDKLEGYEEFGLLNPRICSVELAQKTITSPRYSLSYLNEFLGIHAPASHRAYCDAYVCKKVFDIACLALPKNITSLREVIEFTRGKKL